MAFTLLGIGISGLLGLSVLCPFLAFLAYRLQRQTFKQETAQENRDSLSVLSVDIIIPAHNEAEEIGGTLGSIQGAVAHLRRRSSIGSQPKISVHVGADACTDNTAGIAGQFPLVSVTEFPENRSKWATLSALVTASMADWVILVDVGTRWPDNFLTDFVEKIYAEPAALAIAPSYQPLKAGWLPRTLWKIEWSLKKLESFCGGPVSLHGATVGYQAACLKKAVAYLSGTLWLNDDVVIPLMLRAFYPEGILVYPVGRVKDAGARPDQLDIGRRKRMVLGNLQWVSALLPECFRLNPVAGILAMRRLFRIFWAYWLACIALGLGLACHVPLLPAFGMLAALAVLSGSLRQLTGAALASLLTPFRLVLTDWPLEASWK